MRVHISFSSQGAYAEYIRLPQTNLMAKPTHLSWEEAASIPENFLTGQGGIFPIVRFIHSLQMLIFPLAYQALILIAQCKEGDDVLIHAGASGVGVAAIQLARLYGACVVQGHLARLSALT